VKSLTKFGNSEVLILRIDWWSKRRSSWKRNCF
jgi:hypothetical protein